MSSKHDNIRKAIAAIDAKIARLEHRRGELAQRLTGELSPLVAPTPDDSSSAEGGTLGLESPRERALRHLSAFEGGSYMRFYACLPSTLKEELNQDDMHFLVQKYKELFPDP